METFRIDDAEDFMAEIVVADGADGPALFTETHSVVCEICRSTAQCLSGREHVPEDLTDPDDHFLHALAFFRKIQERYTR